MINSEPHLLLSLKLFIPSTYLSD